MILFVLVIDFYIEAVVINHLQPPKTAVYGAYAIFLSALFFALTWNHPLVSKITTIKEIITNDHVLSGGVVFSLAVFMLGKILFVMQLFCFLFFVDWGMGCF